MSTTTEQPTTAEPEPQPEAVQPDAEPAGDKALALRQHDELEEALAALPLVPGRDEFMAMCQMARIYSQSGVVPRALQGKPADCLVVLMTGRDLGIPITAAFRKVYVIDGQPSIAPQLKISLVRKKRLGNVIPHPANRELDDRQGAIPLGPDGEVFTDAEGNVTGWTGAKGGPYWFSWEDAIVGGYVREGCTPRHHTDDCKKAAANREVRQLRSDGTANFCKDNWRKNPRRMMWQRASGFVADDHFSEATLGLYDPDELGAVVDDEGHLIDVNHVELPEGFTPTGSGRAAGGASSGGGEEEAPASPEQAWAIQLRVYALPEDAQAQFRDVWVKSKKITGALAEKWADGARVQPVYPASKHALLESMLRGVEQNWKAQGRYDPEAGPAALVENVLAPCVAAALGAPPGWQRPTAPPEAAQAPAEQPEAPAAPDAAEPDGGAADGQGGADGEAPAPTAAPDLPALDCPPEVAADADAAQEWAIAYVKGKTLGAVDSELTARTLSIKGKSDERRARLAVAVMRQLGVPRALSEPSG